MSIREELLALLRAHQGSYLSGEEIAEGLSCSRTAVWKAVNALRKEGYDISAVTNRGYALSETSDVLSAEAISSGLPQTYHIRVFQELDSTNTVLKRMTVNGEAEGNAVVISDYQTGGKGRLGRSFFSPRGTGLYLSILLHPQGSAVKNLMLTAQAAAAVYRAVEKTAGIALDIKWVNDLYLNGKKVCGILSEGQTSFETGQVDFVIVGIGINLYEPEDGFPPEIQGKAGSILGKKSGGRTISRNELAAEIIRQMYQLAESDTLAPEYIARNIVPGHEIAVLDGAKSRRAEALRILPDGRLEIREEDGRITDLVYGEVSVRLMPDQGDSIR